MEIRGYKPSPPCYEDVKESIEEMWKTGMFYPGENNKKLLDTLRGQLRSPYITTTNSCSAGLIGAVCYLRRNPTETGDSKVIIPSFTFSATLEAVQWASLQPVVVDVDDNGQMCPDQVRAALEEYQGQIKGIIPVHMWGNACYPEEYRDIGINYEVPIVFDGAHAYGTIFKGHPVSVYGDATVYSIAATKPVSAGEGGVVVCNRQDIYKYVERWSNHGSIGTLDPEIVGTNAKLQDFNAILALGALKDFPRHRARRTKIMEYYRSELNKLSPKIRIWKTREHTDPTYKDCVLFTETPSERNGLETFLNEKGIETKRYFDPAIPDMGSFKGIVHSCDNARNLAATCLALPLYPALTDAEMEYIVSTVRRFYCG